MVKKNWRFKLVEVRQRFRLTPMEKRVAVFVLAAFVLGLITKCYAMHIHRRRYRPTIISTHGRFSVEEILLGSDAPLFRVANRLTKSTNAFRR